MSSETDARAPSVQSDESASPDAESGSGPAPEGVACDFCGEVVPSVRRVALDGEYERLRTRHQVQYSCAACFEKKERTRTADEA